MTEQPTQSHDSATARTSGLATVPAALSERAAFRGAAERGTTAALFGSRTWLLLVVGLLLANLLVGLGTASLWDEDEAAYAGIARNMLETGNGVLQDAPYTKPHRKPPLTFWLMACSYGLFGVNEAAARLPNLLGYCGAAALLGSAGGFLLGRATARLAALVLLSSLLVLNLAKVALTDGVLLFFQTAAALALLRGVLAPNWRATVALWAGVAGGLLTKGPPILFLVGGMFAFLLVFGPRRRNLVHLHPWFGLPLALVPLVGWLVVAWQQDPRMVQFLGYWYLLRRVGSSTFGHAGPPGTHFVLFFVSLAPWTAYLLSGLRGEWRGLRRRRRAYLLLAGWLFGGWLLWELPGSKLPTYPLGAYPALALLIARQVLVTCRSPLGRRTDRALAFGFHAGVVVSALLAAATAFVGFSLGTWWCRALAWAPGVLWLGTSVLALRRQRAAQPGQALRLLLTGHLLANLLAWLVIVPGIGPRCALTRRIAQDIAARCGPGTTVVVAAPAVAPSLPFYVRRGGFEFVDVMQEEIARTAFDVDLSPLWRGNFRAVAKQVKAQTPAKLSAEEDARLRIERAAEWLQSGRPVVLVLDEGQQGALGDQLARARVERYAGWRIDRGREVHYVVAVTQAASRAMPGGGE